MSQHSENPFPNEQTAGTKVPAAIKREHSDPQEDSRPLPFWLMGVFGAIACLSGVYFGMYHGGFSGSVYNESESTPELFANHPVGAGEAAPVAELTLAELGKSVYANCVPCHQATGLGTPGQFPPLVNSDWVVGSEKRLVAILLKGVQGTIKVGDATYNGAMPPWDKALSDKKIAAVASYVRATWGNKAPEISEAKVKAARAEFAGHPDAWKAEELLKIPADATISAPDAPAAAPATAPASTPAAAPAAQAPAPAAGGASVDLAAGKVQYNTCIPCHQPTGMGLPPVFPPLVNSEYVTGNPERMIAIVLKGVVGPITVNGTVFTNVMPPQEVTLTDLQISQVTSYVRATYGNGASAITPEQVAEVRKKLLERKTSWTEAELKAF